ncbi:MAG: galactitol-1-phosphate 5-dehydrogenase [Propioniciclava sp.]
MTAPLTMQAARLHAVADLRVEQVPRPDPGPGEALIRIERSGICGSDIPRVLSKGTYSFPLIPGHEFAGTIVACPDASHRMGERVAIFPLIPCRVCAMCAIGEYATCTDYDYYGSRRDGGFAEYQTVRLENLIPLPEQVSLDAGAMVEPAAVAVHALASAPLRVGDTIAIFGAGPIGMMAAQLARANGARVLLLDIDDRKLALAAAQGWAECLDARKPDVAAQVRERTGGGADVCLEAAGVSATLIGALYAARPFGRVVLMGNPAGQMMLSQDDYWQILRKQLTCTGVWNSTHNRVRDDWQVAIDAMARGQLDPQPLITHRFGLHDSAEAFRVATTPDDLSLKIMFTPGENS